MKTSIYFCILAQCFWTTAHADNWVPVPYLTAISKVDNFNYQIAENDKARLLNACFDSLNAKNPGYEADCSEVGGSLEIKGRVFNTLTGGHAQCGLSCHEPDRHVGRCWIQSLQDDSETGKVNFFMLREPGGSQWTLVDPSGKGNRLLFVSPSLPPEIYTARLAQYAHSCSGWRARCFPEEPCR